jgi:hypothetical protein
LLDRLPEPWPTCNVTREYATRLERLRRLRRNPELWGPIKAYYRDNPQKFIRHWCATYDPRNAGSDIPALLPFVPFRRQRELIDFVYACLHAKQHGLIEKSRDMGATWICCAISVHLFLFWEGASIGWGSRDSLDVDNLGDPDSILEKIRILMRNLPREFYPRGFSVKDHMSHMRIVNPATGATIVGGAGDNIGRGGRSLVVFKDESSHYLHPEAIEASLLANALVQIDLSSVRGVGTVFQRRREAGVDYTPGQPVAVGRVNVFVMDWREHPRNTQEWYDTLRAKLISEGLQHVLAQEVDRDYSAAIEGTVIPAEWVRSAIGAQEKLRLIGDGGWCAALDVADEGGDTNALALRRGVILRSLEEWGERDTGVTARRAVDACMDFLPLNLQYDCIGVGAGVKSETNRLDDENLLPRGLRLVPWNAGEGPQDPDDRVIAGDKDSPLNGDFYANLKAQAWWNLRRRFELTHRAVTDPTFSWDEDDLISLPVDLPLLWKLVKELSQPTMTHNSRMKLLIDKRPEGTKSPNLADALVMLYFPMRVRKPMNITAEVLAQARVGGRR